VKKFIFKKSVLLALFSMITLVGLAYLLFLQFVFPSLVPFYGGGEQIILNKVNDYTQQIPWEANSKLHLSVYTNETVELYSNGEYLGDFTSYKFVVEPCEYILIRLKSDSPVSGRFAAWQEIPSERQALGFTVLLVGLIGLGSSISAMRAPKR
jgi:hypothetical protein